MFLAKGRASHSVFKYLALFSRYMGLVFPIGIVVLRLGDWTYQECQRLKLEAAVTSTLGKSTSLAYERRPLH